MAVDTQQKKKNAALAALDYVREGVLLGVGTGSTVNLFIDALIASGKRIEGAVSSSNASTERLIKGGIEVIDLNDAGTLETYIDGADESTRARHLIKGVVQPSLARRSSRRHPGSSSASPTMPSSFRRSAGSHCRSK